jgi:hypothetical protein
VDVSELPPDCPRWVRRLDDPSLVGRVLFRFDGWYDVLLEDGGKAPWIARATEPYEPPAVSLTHDELAACDAAFEEALAE